ncbi:MAG TPA: nucleotidyltransferase domain-containing protein [Armatimonadota bacterium]|nr:nucleotidyltransferase domain-containing protein [Armatimonadota bacterium]HOS43763.1 nucleotidyltransferase domain-containing protein [Armatimonadota bacterium]
MRKQRLQLQERVSVTLAARVLGSSRVRVYAMIERGELAAERYGPKATVVLRESLLHWLREHGAHVELHGDAVEIIYLPVPLDMARIRAFCRRWEITELAFFGSVVRDDFTATSDVNVLVTFAQSRRVTGLELVRMERELSAVFDRPVDIVSRRGLEQSRNTRLREEILRTAEVIYAQAA